MVKSKEIEGRVLSHLDPEGRARMVDVGAKGLARRTAWVSAEIQMKPSTLALLQSGRLKKGDAFTVAKVAGVLAAKKTAELIPLCHSLPLEHIEIRFVGDIETGRVAIECEASATAKTGVEMEAFTGAAVAALALYDMVKADDPAAVIQHLHLVRKLGGKSAYGI